jgi:hypothetical protein
MLEYAAATTTLTTNSETGRSGELIVFRFLKCEFNFGWIV